MMQKLAPVRVRALFLIFANFDGSQGWLRSQVLCASGTKAKVLVVWGAWRGFLLITAESEQLRGTPARVQDLQTQPQDSLENEGHLCNNQSTRV